MIKCGRRNTKCIRFLWRDKPDENMGYASTRVNIGDKPVGCIAQLTMCETARLDIFTHLEEECRVLEEDAYVDDILNSHNCLDHGCSYLFSQSGRWGTAEQITQKQKAAAQGKTMDMGDGYQVEEGMLYMLTSIYFWKS